VTQAIRKLKLKMPTVPPERAHKLDEARRRLKG
jgi:hypothetical protein